MTTATLTTDASTSSHPPRRLLRSTGAVFAGLLTIVVLSSAADAVMHAVGLYPPFPQRMADGLLVLATAYRVVFGVAGCWLTARLAPRRPMAHALVLGSIGVALSIAGAVTFGKYGPAWYAVAIIAISLPCAWAGGRLARRR